MPLPRSIGILPALTAFVCLAATTGWLASAPSAQAAGFLSNTEPKSQEKPSFAAPAARKPVEGEGAEALESELYNAGLAVRETRQNLETAQYAYKRSRTRGYPRGDKLLEIKGRLAKMETERDEAERSFLAAYEKARAGGVAAAFLSDYYDLEEDISSKR
jgi:hypothetical protein